MDRQLGVIAAMASIVLFLAFVQVSNAQPRVASELIVLASQPSVYLVQTYGDFNLVYPKAVTIDEELLKKDVAADRTAGKVQGARTDAQHAWVLLATQIDKYLSCSDQTLTAALKDSAYASGTAFAVSREGILLTNAHVLGDPDPDNVPNLVAVESLISTAINPIITGLAAKLGGVPIEVDRPAVAGRMTTWWCKHSRTTGKFRQLRLVLKYDRPSTKFSLGQPPSFFTQQKPITIPLEVLAVGEAAPGKDVAVLRAIMRPNDRQKLKAGGARDDEIEQMIKAGQEDKLICLPLGDSSRILPGARVQAMGFPGSAFLDGWMTEAALFRVSAHDGQVSQTKPVLGGYDMIQMTAAIDHGDSGGPVLDVNGRVIAINVGGGENGATTLAVPINVAKEFLAKAGIKPDPGKLSDRWIEAVQAFGAGDMTRAGQLLRLIEANQGHEMTLMATQTNPLELQPPRPAALGRQQADQYLAEDLINPYVRDLQRRVAAKP